MFNLICCLKWRIWSCYLRIKYYYTYFLAASLKKLGISCKTDNAGVALGKKYARTDEIGIPFAITVDKETLTA